MRSTCLLALLLLSLTACSSEQLGLPATALSVKSPDGRFVAFVRNHWTPDPPEQSIWIAAEGASATRLRALGGDVGWCKTIVWSADSSTAGYLIEDALLVTVDARQARIIGETPLTRSAGYPPSRMASELSLSADGRQARFRDCHRPYQNDTPYDCGDFQSRTIEPAEESVPLVTAPSKQHLRN